MYSMILLKEDHVNVAVQQLFARLGTLVIRGTWYTAYVCNKVGSNCKRVQELTVLYIHYNLIYMGSRRQAGN